MAEKSKTPVHNFIDLTGERFGRLKVVERVANNKHGQARWKCLCDCGNENIVTTGGLRSGHSKSCGCLTVNRSQERMTTHGKRNHPLYGLWLNIKQRCTNSNRKDYKDYGGRGICVCKRWVDDFSAFYQWAMANEYRKGLTIERIDSDGPYSPKNCIFIPKSEQSKNRRGLRLITFNGATKNMSQWAKEIGIDPMTLKDRFKNGWSIKEALTTPPLKPGHHRK